MKFKSIIVLSLILLTACDKDLTVDTSPRGDFELFFAYLENDYAYRDYHPFTMEELRQKYLPQIEASNTKEMLANILLNIQLNELQDPHVYIDDDEPWYLTNVREKSPVHLDEALPLFREIHVIQHTPYYTYGLTKANPRIGYIYIRAFNSDVGGTSSLHIDAGVKEIDNIIQELRHQGIVSMIVDMRSDAGGSNYVPRYVAQHFVNRSAVYMVEEYPVVHSFTRKEWTVTPSGGTGFREGKIALLSNGMTASGGEMFLLAMLQRDNLIHIGSRSAGASGNITEKDLSNGWNMTITNSRTEYPDGRQYFKVGIVPAVIVENDSTYGDITFTDRLIEEAIRVLQ